MRTLLVLLVAVPAVSAVLAAVSGSRRAGVARAIALAATVVNVVFAALVAVNFASERLRAPEPPERTAAGAPTFRPEFVPGAPGVRLNASGAPVPDDHATSWAIIRLGPRPGDPAVAFYLGLDGLNVWLVVLTAVLMVSAVLVSWAAVAERTNEYYAWLLALETGMLGVFLSFDIILFYVFFELTLVPLFFLIGIWGGPQRRYAARKFFIYTLTGSVITLLGVLGVVVAAYGRQNELTFSIPRLIEVVNRPVNLQDPSWRSVQLWVFLALAAGFAVKVPLVPLHTWLPLAHVEAPTAGSVLLAGVLLKIGSYGFLRLCLPLAPLASLNPGVPLIATLAVVGVVYGAFCALAQNDIKKLVAYSSVSHLGFCMLGMFALNPAGLSGSVLQMINHGLSTGALFLLVGMLYERYHTRLLADYGGMAARLHALAFFMVFICLTSIGLPGLNGFVGEVLVLMGIFDFQWARGQWPWLAVVGSTGIVLGAWYLLTMLMRAFFGPFREPRTGSHGPVRDLNLREWAALVPIAALCLAIGVYPQPLLDTMKRDVAVVDRLVHPTTDAATASEDEIGNAGVGEAPGSRRP